MILVTVGSLHQVSEILLQSVLQDVGDETQDRLEHEDNEDEYRVLQYVLMCYSHGDTSDQTDHCQEVPAVGEDCRVAEDSSHHGHQACQQDQQARALPPQL